jgi:hypothetical protein
MFQSIIDWYSSDETAKKKILFFIGASIFVFLFVSLIIIINFSPINSTNTQNSSSLSSSNQQAENIKKNEEKIKENLEARKLEKISEFQPLNSKSFWVKKDELIYFDSAGRLVYNNSVVNNNFTAFAHSINKIQDYVIINQNGKVNLYNLKNNEVEQISNKILTATVWQNSIYTVEKNISTESSLQIKVYSSIDELKSNNSRVFATGNLDRIQDMIEIRRVGNIFLVLGFENKVRNGFVSVNFIQNSSLVNLGSFDDVIDMKFSDTAFVLNNLNDDNIRYYNFSSIVTNAEDIKKIFVDANTPVINNILRENQINPFVLASRCDFKSSISLFCLVKEKETSSINDVYEFDKIVEINLQTKKITKPYDNLLLSARSLYWDAQNSTHLLIAQIDNKLYKITKL